MSARKPLRLVTVGLMLTLGLLGPTIVGGLASTHPAHAAARVGPGPHRGPGDWREGNNFRLMNHPHPST